jgi:hypothetical protein
MLQRIEGLMRILKGGQKPSSRANCPRAVEGRPEALFTGKLPAGGGGWPPAIVENEIGPQAATSLGIEVAEYTFEKLSPGMVLGPGLLCTVNHALCELIITGDSF